MTAIGIVLGAIACLAHFALAGRSRLSSWAGFLLSLAFHALALVVDRTVVPFFYVGVWVALFGLLVLMALVLVSLALLPEVEEP